MKPVVKDTYARRLEVRSKDVEGIHLEKHVMLCLYGLMAFSGLLASWRQIADEDITSWTPNAKAQAYHGQEPQNRMFIVIGPYISTQANTPFGVSGTDSRIPS